MNKIFIIVLFVTITVFILFVYNYYYNINKEKAIKIISESNMQDSKLFINRDEKYLIEWAKAIRLKNKTFTWNGKFYSVFGGQLV